MTVIREFWARGRVGAQAGFSLVELLTAAALTVLMASVLLGLVGTTLTHWDRNVGALSAEEQARGALDQLERDLNAAWTRDDGSVWLVATIQPDTSASGIWTGGSKPVVGSLDATAANIGDARFGRAGVWLRFFTRVVLVNSGEGPVAVAYQIVRRAPTPSGSSAHYLLYRAEVPSAATLAAGYDLASAAYASATDVVGGPGNVVRPAHRQLLADHVVDFGVRFFAYVQDTTTGTTALRQIFPNGAADLEYRAQRPATPLETTHPFPTVVEVMVRVLTPEGTRQISALEAGRRGGDWWTIVAAHSRVFVRRISVRTCLP